MLLKWYDKLNSFCHGRYWKSWLAHFITYFVFSILGALVNLNPIFFVGVGVGQELTQFDQWRFNIKWYDYVLDLVSDGIGIYLAYLLF